MKQRIHFSVAFLTLVLFVIALYIGCKRNFDDITDPDKTCTSCQPKNSDHLFIRSSTSSGASDRDDDENEIGNRKVLLGAQRANPFSVTAMTQAWNTLWPNHPVIALPPSHLYVRFRPGSLEEYKLLEPSDIPLTTFRLYYEIVQQGDWYDDPAIPNDQVPWFYSVVPANFQFPAVPYDILESLVLAPMKSELTRRSFMIQAQNSGAVAYRDGCTPQCESWPECTEAEHEEGCDVYFTYPGSHNPPSPHDPPNDIYGDPINSNLGHQGTPIFNSCGCSVTSEPRNPGGCIKVVDTQLPVNGTLLGTPVHLEGVAQAKVTWWNGWFGFFTTHTDGNGCWQITDHIDYGRGWMWVTFENDRAVIRGLRDQNIWEYAFGVTDAIGEIGGPTFNNVSVVYTPTGGDGAATRLFWYAATCNNALYEYHQYAAQDGIAPPQNNLDILLSNRVGDASTPMLEKAGVGILLYASGPLVNSFLLRVPYIGGVLGTLAQALIQFVAIWAPDVAYAYGGEAMVSDVVKETFYHEFGHAAHFNALNNNAYWIANIEFVLDNFVDDNNPPFGRRGTDGFQRCAIIEAWGSHIAPHYADRKYGLFHSRTMSLDPEVIESRRWIYAIEEFQPDADGNPGLDSYIPEGLFRDLIDNNSLNPSGVIDPIDVDPISGFSHANCFNAVTAGDSQYLSGVEANINTTLPPGVTTAMTADLFALYGY